MRFATSRNFLRSASGTLLSLCLLAVPSLRADTDKETRVVRLGAMCGGPTAFTVFRDIRHYLGQHGMKTEFVLYSNYDDLIKALQDGNVDIAWNTPSAHGKFHLLAGGSQALVMRDTDVNYRVQLIVHKDAGIKSIGDLQGKTMIFGNCDAADATVLPVYFLRKQGVRFDDVKILSLHKERDARGMACHSPKHVWKALKEKRGHAGILGVDRWAQLQKSDPEETANFVAIWTSPPFSHCVWSARKDFDKELGSRFTKLMTAMDVRDPLTAEILELKHCSRWVSAGQDGYRELLDALSQRTPLPGAAKK